MRPTKIPRKDWSRFFAGFVSTHRGHLCSMAIVTPEYEPRVRLQPLLLAGLGPESDPEDSDVTIRVLLSDWYGDHLAHVIHGPRQVLVSRVAEETREAVEIDCAEGRVVMSFQAAS
jgi:hypothetical protein